MPSSKEDLTNLKVPEPYTVSRAQEIFRKSLKTTYNLKNTAEKFDQPVSYLNSQSKKIKIVRKISAEYLKKSFLYFYLKQPSRTLYAKGIKSFYTAYKLSIYSLLLLVDFKLIKKLNNFKKGFSAQKNFSKYYSKLIYPKIKNIKTFYVEFLNLFKKRTTKILKNLLTSKKTLESKYKKNLYFYSLSSFLLNLFYRIDTRLIYFIYKIFENLFEQVNFSKINKNINSLYNKLYVNIYGKSIHKIKNFLYNFLSFNSKQIREFFKRLFLIIGIYFLPFIFLATQALVPLIDEYEYLIINPVSSTIFSRVPFLIDLIKLLRPLITNPMLLFWVPLAYYLAFTSAYRSLKISYKIAYNGTIAAIFLIINYSCFLMQFMLKLAFESVKIIKDIVFTSYLIKHLDKNKNKERDEVMKIFASLVNRYDSEIRKNYYEFLLLINHRIFSHLALISLAALVYNCLYYIIYSKNPEIILVTKTALATIKNPQKEN
uniref:hypothetical protein Ycf60 n=1 Tax=Neustupella aerophytica TaxID=2962111 RepID=UPI00218234E6|nr:hypothetical protein Ycf60 [Neustupella aerophytica]UVI61120.1 hypothetical protein Ycf60 [Neustupella aerophytica]